MPGFQYKAVDGAARRINGSIDAPTEADALKLLGARGIQVFELNRAGGAGIDATSSGITPPSDLRRLTGAFGGRGRARVSMADLLLSIQELATLLDAGIPLADAVENIARGYEDRPLGSSLNAVYAALRSGIGFARALADARLPLPAYVHELVRAGEETGRLAQALRSAAVQMEADARFRREARNALTYPLLLVFSGLIATLVVFIFVVPKFAGILNNPKADIPAISAWVLQAGLWLVANKLLATGIAVGITVAAGALVAQPGFRAWLWEAASVTPVLKRWIEHVELARWGSMLSVLLSHHVPLLEALSHSTNSLAGRDWRRKAELITGDVRGGKSLAEAMQVHHFVDAVGLNLVRVGERSGALAKTVGSLADMHRTSSEQSLKQFLVLLEPLTILLVSVLLGGIMISVMLAITSLTNVI